MQEYAHADHPTGINCRLSLIAFLAVILTVPKLFGDDRTWINKSPEGSTINALAIDPENPQTVYAATSGGIFKSTDGGGRWMAVSKGLPGSLVYSLAIDPNARETIYAGIYGGGVYKSTDGAIRWTGVNQGLSEPYLFILAMHPQISQTIYVGTQSGKVFKSTDGAAHWILANTGLGSSNVYALTVNPQQPEILFAGTLSDGVYKSTDGGNHWAASNAGLTSTYIKALAVDPNNAQIVYAGTYSGLFRSTDGGNHWSLYDAVLTGTVESLATDVSAAGTAYAGTYSGIVFKTTDNGDHWTAAGRCGEARGINALAIDPQTPQTIYAGSDSGMFKSTDHAMEWDSANKGMDGVYITSLAIDPAGPQTVYAGTLGGGVYKSMDRGSYWNSINSGLSTFDILALAIDPTAPQVVYAGNYKSINGGSRWSALNINTGSIRALAINPQTPRIVYVGSNGGGVFKSTDDGNHWQEMNAGLGNLQVFELAIDPLIPETVYAGTLGGGVFKSTDGGSHWGAFSAGITSPQVCSLVIDPAASQTIYAGTNGGGIFKSTNGGISWWPANTGLINYQVWAMAIDPTAPQTIYAGTTRSGVFESTDGGDHWNEINTGLPDMSITQVYALAVAGGPQKTVYAGTVRGIWAFSNRSSLAFSLPSGGTAVGGTIGAESLARSGYATLALSSGATPYGTAVFSFTQNGTVVSEAGVPASPPTTSARLFIDYRTSVNAVPARTGLDTVGINTGIAIVNPGSSTANITYTLRDYDGNTVAVGHGIIEAGHHIACFIDYLKDVAASDFNLPPSFRSDIQFGTLDLASNEPISVLALRGTTNQRNEFLITTTPVADLAAPLNSTPIYFPQFVDGGGYTTSLILMNTSSETETGSFQIIDGNGNLFTVTPAGGLAASSFSYSIPPGGIFHFQTDGSPSDPKAGWVRLIPDAGTSTPVGSGVFGFTPSDILVSESGIPSAASTTHAHVYVDLSGNHNTGLAVANITDSNANIVIKAYQNDGVTAAGSNHEPVSLPGYGYSAAFATSFISGLPQGFTGVLDISAATPFAALTLRSLDNERGEFLMTTFPVADATRAAPSPIVFPHIVDGGGYATEFIFLSTAGESGATLGVYGEHGDPLPAMK